MNKRRTDNSYLEDKVMLRLNHLPAKKDLLILDVFGGEGKVWNEVKKRTNKIITIMRIDARPELPGIYIHGDNRKVLPSLDLTRYDVIDLDAYGIPFEQLKIVLSSARPGTIVFVTYIQSGMGGLSHGMLRELGYSRKMVSKCPTLFSRHGIEKLYRYLGNAGIKTLSVRSADRKHYLVFNVE